MTEQTTPATATPQGAGPTPQYWAPDPSDAARPTIPGCVVQAITSYGDARSDDDIGMAFARLGALIHALRDWAGALVDPQPGCIPQHLRELDFGPVPGSVLEWPDNDLDDISTKQLRELSNKAFGDYIHRLRDRARRADVLKQERDDARKGCERLSLATKQAAAPDTSEVARVDAPGLTDEYLRVWWQDHGGRFYGPRVETGAMREVDLLPLLRALLAAQPAAPSVDAPEKPSLDHPA